MDRLTEHSKKNFDNIIYSGNDEIEIVKKLAAYEDTGLNPEEIKDILSIISESQDDVNEDGISTGMINDLIELAKYRQADKQDLVKR